MGKEKEEKSWTIRAPKYIVNQADRIAEKNSIPRTEALGILFQKSNDHNLNKTISRVEDELFRNLILEFEKEEIKKLIKALNLGVFIRKIAEENGSVRKERLEILNNILGEAYTKFRDKIEFKEEE